MTTTQFGRVLENVNGSLIFSGHLNFIVEGRIAKFNVTETFELFIQHIIRTDKVGGAIVTSISSKRSVDCPSTYRSYCVWTESFAFFRFLRFQRFRHIVADE